MDFPGDDKSHRIAWSAWRRHILGIAFRAGTQRYGLVGFVVSPAEWLTLQGIVGPFVPVPDPGAPPAPAPAANFSAWKVEKDLFDKENGQLQAFTLAVIQALDPEALALVSDPIWGTMSRTLSQMMALLQTEYGVLSSTDLDSIEDSLALPFMPATQSVREYTNNHVKAYETLTAAGTVLPEQQKVKALRKGFRGVLPFSKTVETYLDLHPLVAQQTFAGLSAALHAKADNTTTTETTGGAGYAGAAIAPPPTQMAAAAAGAPTSATYITMTDAKKLIDVAVQSALASRAAPRGGRRPMLWCWSHGDNYSHPSLGCNKRSVGHQTTATKANPMGSAHH